MIKFKNLLIALVFALMVSGCASVNKNGVMLQFNPSSRELKVDLMASAKYLTKIKTTRNNDTLKLLIYEQVVFLTILKTNKSGIKTIVVEDGVNYIEHRDSVYAILDLPILE